MLLTLQAEDRGIRLTRVAGFNRWKELGRAVRRGEKGLAILAPLKRRLSAEEAVQLAAKAKLAYDSEGRPVIVIRGFRIEHVWDQSQTDPIPGAEQLPEPPNWLTQHGDGPAGLWDGVCALIKAAGYSIEHRPPTAGDGSAHGRSDHDRHIVWIRSDVDQAEQIRVAIHELAHLRAVGRLHHRVVRRRHRHPRNRPRCHPRHRGGDRCRPRRPGSRRGVTAGWCAPPPAGGKPSRWPLLTSHTASQSLTVEVVIDRFAAIIIR